MIIIISPAKRQDFSVSSNQRYSQARLLDKSKILVEVIKQLSVFEWAKLMKISKALSQKNWQRFQRFQDDFAPPHAKQAILAFKGDVYTCMDVDTFQADDFTFAQQHLRILSGLYGLLRPLDLIQPYRLEMGTQLVTKQGKNLYEFWHNQLTQLLNQDLLAFSPDPVLINLASAEYFKAIQTKQLNARVITPVFKEESQGEYKIIGLYAKRARGLMTQFIIKNRLTDSEQIKSFNQDGYNFNETLSTQQQWLFSRHLKR